MSFPMEGHCACVRYQIATAPMIVHCCHCRWCQRESGSAFALNARLEAGACIAYIIIGFGMMALASGLLAR